MPHDHKLPSSSIANEEEIPVSAWTNFVPLVICTGVLLRSLSPVPNFPLPLLPHAHRLPAMSIANVYELPA